jgi:acyl carrier protein
MTVLDRIVDILSDILDLPSSDISGESYLVRDLNAESIDLLEIAVTLNAEFKTEIDDDEIFMKNLRIHLEEAGASADDRLTALLKNYPFLSRERLTGILSDLDGGPVLKVKDLASYILFKAGQP